MTDAETLTALLLDDDSATALTRAWDWISATIPELGALDMDMVVDGKRVEHKDNVTHTIAVTAAVPPRLRVRLVALFHDVGKPLTRAVEDGQVTFHAHESVGARLVTPTLVRLGYDRDLARQVADLVRHSGTTKGSVGWSDAAVRRLAVTMSDLLEDLLDFADVDVTSRHPEKHAAVHAEIATLRRRLGEVAAADTVAAWRPTVSGDDIMTRYGFSPGPQVGTFLGAAARAEREALSEGRPWSAEDAWALLDTMPYQFTRAQ